MFRGVATKMPPFPTLSPKLKPQFQVLCQQATQTHEKSQVQRQRTINHHLRDAETIKERQAEPITEKKKANRSMKKML